MKMNGGAKMMMAIAFTCGFLLGASLGGLYIFASMKQNSKTKKISNVLYRSCGAVHEKIPRP